MYYIYEWYNVNTNEVFYIGKGSNGRFKSMDSRNKLFKEYISNNECNVRITEKFDDEESCYQREIDLILSLNPKCNILRVKGNVNNITDEFRQHMSDNNPMHAEEQRQRMSVNNPMHNPKVAAKVAAQKKTPIIIGDMRFDGIVDAAKYYGLKSPNTIRFWLINEQTPKKYGSLKCGYDNQQPSRENTDNSISEGSTTND